MSPIKFAILGILVIFVVWLTDPKPINPLSFGSIYVPMAFGLWSIFYIGLHIISENNKVECESN